MFKRMVFKVILLPWLLLLCGLGTPARGYAQVVLRIGIVASLSGPQAQVGQELRDGALLAMEHINGEWKEKGVRLEALVEDDGTLPELAREAAYRLIRKEKVNLLFGVADSDCALSVMPLVDQEQIPWITPATHAELTHPLKRWIFRGNISDRDQSRILVDLMWERTLDKRIALLHEDTAYGKSGASSQAARIKKYGGSPVIEILYSRGEPDFSPILERIKEAGAEGILIYGVASDAPAILRQLREMNLGARIMASSGWDTRRVSNLPPSLTEGVVVAGYSAFAYGDREDELGPSWAQFAQTFHDRFGREPDAMAGLSYSNMMCLAAAYERIGFRFERLIEGLEETKAFNTLLETRITYSDESRDGVAVLHLAEFKGGRAVEWRRNLFARDYRFGAPSRPVKIGDYEGKIYEGQTGIAVWMLLHFAFGRPPFLKEFPVVDEYGIKSCFIGSLFKGEVRVPVFKLIFRSEKEAIEALNIESSEEEGEASEAPNSFNYRNADSGAYTDGTFWSGYKRLKNVLVLIEGGIPREDLEMLLDALGQPLENSTRTP